MIFRHRAAAETQSFALGDNLNLSRFSAKSPRLGGEKF